MNELMTGWLVVSTELSAVLVLGGVVLLVLLILRKRKQRRMARELIQRLRQAEPERRQRLVALLKDNFEMTDEQAEAQARTMLRCETSLYSHVLKMFMGQAPEQILHLDHDVDKLVKNYAHLLEQESEQDDAHESVIVKLRKENAQLREEKATLQKNLETTMETLENMMDEYASMYEGGHKEGEQRMKNEMFKLQQKIGKTVSSSGEDKSQDEDGAIPELGLDEEEPKT